MNEYLFKRVSDYIEALWCRDSETSEEYLINLRTSEIIAKRVNGKIVDPSFIPSSTSDTSKQQEKLC